MNVDFPHPLGPMTAVTARGSAAIETSCRTWFDPNHAFSSQTSILLTSADVPFCPWSAEGIGRRGESGAATDPSSLVTFIRPYSAACSTTPGP